MKKKKHACSREEEKRNMPAAGMMKGAQTEWKV